MQIVIAYVLSHLEWILIPLVTALDPALVQPVKEALAANPGWAGLAIVVAVIIKWAAVKYLRNAPPAEAVKSRTGI